jgi:hypothetical protein
MTPMSPRRHRTLIIGLALFIIGPTLGLCAYLAVVLRALPRGTSLSPAEALAQLQQLPGQLALALIPATIGLVFGAIGLFMIISSLAVHFLGSAAASEHQPSFASRTRIPDPTQTQRMAPVPVADDSRYMPKFQ